LPIAVIALPWSIQSTIPQKKPHKEKMIESSQRMMGQENNPIVNKHFELQIKTLLQNAPRDADKLHTLLKAKEREKQQAIHIEKIHKGSLQRLKCFALYCIW
jgi:hypothetical protein